MELGPGLHIGIIIMSFHSTLDPFHPIYDVKYKHNLAALDQAPYMAQVGDIRGGGKVCGTSNLVGIGLLPLPPMYVLRCRGHVLRGGCGDVYE